jgi:hypothetical protein
MRAGSRTYEANSVLLHRRRNIACERGRLHRVRARARAARLQRVRARDGAHSSSASIRLLQSTRAAELPYTARRQRLRHPVTPARRAVKPGYQPVSESRSRGTPSESRLRRSAATRRRRRRPPSSFVLCRAGRADREGGTWEKGGNLSGGAATRMARSRCGPRAVIRAKTYLCFANGPGPGFAHSRDNAGRTHASREAGSDDARGGGDQVEAAAKPLDHANSPRGAQLCSVRRRAGLARCLSALRLATACGSGRGRGHRRDVAVWPGTLRRGGTGQRESCQVDQHGFR